MPYPYNNYQQNYPYPNQYQAPVQPLLTRVRDEQEVINYPVAPGVTAFFIDESAQTIFSKTMDASQLDRPRIVKFTRVPEEPVKEQHYATIDDLNHLREEMKDMLMAYKITTPNEHINDLLNTEVV